MSKAPQTFKRREMAHHIDFCHRRYFDNDPRHDGVSIWVHDLVSERMRAEQGQDENSVLEVYSREANIE